MQIFQDMNHPRQTRPGWFLPFEFNRVLVYNSTIFNLSYGGRRLYQYNEDNFRFQL